MELKDFSFLVTGEKSKDTIIVNMEFLISENNFVICEDLAEGYHEGGSIWIGDDLQEKTFRIDISFIKLSQRKRKKRRKR